VGRAAFLETGSRVGPNELIATLRAQGVEVEALVFGVVDISVELDLLRQLGGVRRMISRRCRERSVHP